LEHQTSELQLAPQSAPVPKAGAVLDPSGGTHLNSAVYGYGSTRMSQSVVETVAKGFLKVEQPWFLSHWIYRSTGRERTCVQGRFPVLCRNRLFSNS